MGALCAHNIMDFAICKGIAELRYNFPVFDYIGKNKDINSFLSSGYSRDNHRFAIWFILSEEINVEYESGVDSDMCPIYEPYDGHYPISTIKLESHTGNNLPTLCYIQTNNNYKDRGYSKILIGLFVKWLKDNGYNYLIRSFPTTDGELYSFSNISNALTANGIKFEVQHM